MRRARRLPLEDLAPYLLDLPVSLPAASAVQEKPQPLDWQAVFGNEHPVEIEVGSGKGMFLVNACTAQPQINFLGIEIERKYALYAANRLAKRGLSNGKMLCGDARLFLRDWVADASLQAVHVYFPDPWWKKRHRKRRVFNEDFARHIARVLRPGGFLYLATDVAEYFSEILALVDRETHLRALPPPEMKTPQHDLDYLTNFERKYRLENRPIFRAVFQS